jgi:hypothetical protein
MAVEQRADFGGVFFVDVTYDAADLAAGAIVDAAVTVPGVLSTDVVIAVMGPAALDAGLLIQSARVASANTVTVRLFNSTAGAINEASGVYRFIIGRP